MKLFIFIVILSFILGFAIGQSFDDGFCQYGRDAIRGTYTDCNNNVFYENGTFKEYYDVNVATGEEDKDGN